MKIFLLTCLVLLAIFFLLNKIFYSARKNLFKGQESWSGKDIKIKYNKKDESCKSNKKGNYLEMIADESEIYLDEQSKKE